MDRSCGSFVTELCNATMGMSPEIVIDGDPDATFAYVLYPPTIYKSLKGTLATFPCTWNTY